MKSFRLVASLLIAGLSAVAISCSVPLEEQPTRAANVAVSPTSVDVSGPTALSEEAKESSSPIGVSQPSALPTSMATDLFDDGEELTESTDPTQATPTQTSLPTSTRPEVPPNAPPRPILFALDDDLYRTAVDGSVVEQLTNGRQLGWGMAATPVRDDWQIVAKSLPPLVSPDGRWIAVSPNASQVSLIDVSARTVDNVLVPGSQIYAWSPDSQHLAYAAQSGEPELDQLYSYNVATRNAIPLLDEPAPLISSLAWSPDGSHVAYGCCFSRNTSTEEQSSADTGQLRMIDLTSGQTEMVGELWRSVAGGIQTFCWTEPGLVMPVEASEERTADCSIPLDQSVSPDGLWRFYVEAAPQTDPAAEILYQLVVENVTTSEAWRRDLETSAWPIAWSSDGAYILMDDGDNHSPIWRLPANGVGEPEIVVEDGYLLEVVKAWE